VAVRLQLAYCWLKRTFISSAEKLSGSNPFSPKTPNFDFLTPKYVSKDCLQVHELKRAFKNTSNMKSNIISTQFINSTHFYKNPQQQLNSLHKSEIMNTQGMNHQQQHLITTKTSIKHEFINNPSTTIHSSSILGKTQVYMYKHHKHVKFNINNLIIFKFIYPNIASKHKHEFHQLKSQ